ncbi:MAG: mannose-1-phosphate guanylyltransferase, partial [Candidatus Polarisedimenticolia bacterium]
MILAGGSGSRLWPLVRARRPKPFLPLVEGKTLFRHTYERMAPLVRPDRLFVVGSASHIRWIRREAPGIPRAQIVAEEVGRNTAPAIALAALRVARADPRAVMIVVPADHHIGPAEGFRRTMRRGVEAVLGREVLLIVGVPPRGPATGFGYLRAGAGGPVTGVRPVASFVEKPGPAAARRMWRSGRYMWNSGIFIWRAATILEELRRLQPALRRHVERWSRDAPHGFWKVPEKVMRRLPSLPIDTAVLERSRRVVCLRAGFRWSDLGSWDAIWEFLGRDTAGNGGCGARVTLGARGCLAMNPDGLTVLAGVRDLVVVRDGDAVLVCARHG